MRAVVRESMQRVSSASSAPWALAWVGMLAVMASLGFGRFAYTILLPSTRDGMALTYTQAGILATANLAGYLLGSLATGWISRRLSAHQTTTGGLLLLGASLVWMGNVWTFGEAVASRTVAGVASAAVYLQAVALSGMRFPPRTRGLASGVMHAGNGAGLILAGLGLPLILAIAPTWGWRAGWGVLGAATLVTLPVTWVYLRSSAGAESSSALRPAPASGEFGSPRMAVTRPLRLYAALYGLFGLSYIIYVTFFAETLGRRGFSLSEGGRMWALAGALSAGSGPLWGALSDRIGRLEGIAIVFVLQAGAYLAFLHTGSWSLLLSVTLFGVTAWGIPAIIGAATSEVGYTDGVTALGQASIVMGLGQAVGPTLAGALADATGTVGSSLWVATLAALGGGALSVVSAFTRRRVICGKPRASSPDS